MIILDEGPATVRPIFADARPRAAGTSPPEAQPRDWTWANWALSLLTGPAAALLMAFALTRVSGSALCSRAACPELKVHGSLFGLLYHGAAGVAALTLFLAFFLATHRRGFAVWVCGWALLAADLMVLLAVF
ncbi:hypothetical protein K3U94_17575 [Mycolicibacter heraklionensis]|uniref:Uncharacterized protein n=1 Tax=Mycolicibacter heraklionensis TaxID=512402 RepID=A0A9X7ZDP1_9MYCO|nr:hypothetical protein [Mycolicibacter heraklionensis]QZA06786.1 hypothetical protein K3U94_17575 [Mycolicibacter heraklionensis]